MLEKYNDLFYLYKQFMIKNSKYEPRIVKTNTNTSAYFPLIVFNLSNTVNTSECTLDKIENYNEHYYTLNIFTKDKLNGTNKIASQIINDELTSLTLEFFEKLNIKITQCALLPNIDSNILRRNIMCQCLIGSARGNIVRR